MSLNPLTATDYVRAATDLGVELAAIKAVAEVESRDAGFIKDEKGNYVPIILFERHKMYSFLVAKKINTAQLPTDIVNSKAGGYKGGIAEHSRLQRAVAIDRESALKSCSWGIFQIMGFHWKTLGYTSVQNFVNAMYRGEGDQLDAFVRFIKADASLHRALKNKQWATFARLYNGPAYATNKYDKKMEAAYNRFKGK